MEKYLPDTSGHNRRQPAHKIDDDDHIGIVSVDVEKDRPRGPLQSGR
jgi:hypothetical protein